MAEKAWLRLALAAEVGPVLGHRLLAALGTPEAVFAADERALLAVPGLGPSRLARLRDPAAARAADEEWDRVRAGGARIVTLLDDEYPVLLRRLESPPLVLWVRGRIKPEDRLAVAVVGPRNPSSYAKIMAQALAPVLAAHGLTLVSGMAFGIDTEAHRAAVESAERGAGGRTLAVLGQGLGTRLYPQSNVELAERLIESDAGALISIFPMTTEPSAGLFPMRNEIIAALALGTLVIEASATSGTLITARHAAAAGRVVMACPGDATRLAAQGSNRLLSEGAFLIQKPEEVLAALAQELRREKQALEEELGPGDDWPDEVAAAGQATNRKSDTASAVLDGPPPDLSRLDPLARAIVELLAAEPLPADVILEKCSEHGHTLNAVLGALLRLEMDGHLKQMPGRLYVLTRLP